MTRCSFRGFVRLLSCLVMAAVLASPAAVHADQAQCFYDELEGEEKGEEKKKVSGEKKKMSGTFLSPVCATREQGGQRVTRHASRYLIGMPRQP